MAKSVGLKTCEGWCIGEMTKALLRFVESMSGCPSLTLWKNVSRNVSWEVEGRCESCHQRVHQKQETTTHMG